MVIWAVHTYQNIFQYVLSSTSFTNYTAWKWQLEKKNHDLAPELAAYTLTRSFRYASHQCGRDSLTPNCHIYTVAACTSYTSLHNTYWQHVLSTSPHSSSCEEQQLTQLLSLRTTSPHSPFCEEQPAHTAPLVKNNRLTQLLTWRKTSPHSSSCEEKPAHTAPLVKNNQPTHACAHAHTHITNPQNVSPLVNLPDCTIVPLDAFDWWMQTAGPHVMTQLLRDHRSKIPTQNDTCYINTTSRDSPPLASLHCNGAPLTTSHDGIAMMALPQ